MLKKVEVHLTRVWVYREVSNAQGLVSDTIASSDSDAIASSDGIGMMLPFQPLLNDSIALSDTTAFGFITCTLCRKNY